MYAKVIIKAILSAISSLGASLILLFTAPGVTQFSNITEVSYAIAVITAVITGVAILLTSLSDSPANIRQTDNLVAAAANLDLASKVIQ